MPTRDSASAGAPCWIDLFTDDVAASHAFYTELFGWTVEDAGDPAETGGYAMFYDGGRRVAGIGPVMGEGQPTYWADFVRSKLGDDT